MADYSSHQKKIIERYYDNREQIQLTRLQELVTEIYLAESPKKLDQLWKRAATAMQNLKVAPRLAEHILTKRDPKVLATNLQDWLKKPPAAGPKTGGGPGGTRSRR